MWNNSYRTPTELWQKTSDFPKGKKLPMYQSRAKEKRKNRDKRIGMGPGPLGGTVKEEKFPHTRKPLHWWRQGVGEASEPWRRSQQGCRGQSGEIPVQRISADQHSPAWETCLLAHQDGWGLGAEAPALEVRSQGEDWGWLREHSLKGANAPQLSGRESGKILEVPKRKGDHCFGVCKGREFRALPKWAPEKGVNHSYPPAHQRWAWNSKAAAAATKKPMCKHRSISTPPLPGPCAAYHC